ncbi:MAG: hypothetical protein MJ189_03370, partial [Coriobacteriales bacterium]|nr:hypothetical protein [Coriobacteriales bacterium]
IISILLIIVATIGIIYCIKAMSDISFIISEGAATQDSALLVGGIYTLGLILCLVVIPPAIVGIIVFIIPKLSMLGIIFGIFGIFAVIIYFFVALVGFNATAFATYGYSVALLIAPVIYLICCIVINKNYKSAKKNVENV